ncbi:hypothetical protein BU23DRAFT_219240 [Bimuria novae-zelandiae CBS 107.79]|uniref:F-box domain-containing protein n=1 Tax=Bimuria novae-zelandiae CBS 107.79 TaxID=1447943 RepID=A0A6A5V185_9PLEO|nr:hypothetical protein BU23DRAFT_219240 [Bimuria novae-zelandiae CBS 107.79]
MDAYAALLLLSCTKITFLSILEGFRCKTIWTDFMDQLTMYENLKHVHIDFPGLSLQDVAPLFRPGRLRELSISGLLCRPGESQCLPPATFSIKDLRLGICSPETIGPMVSACGGLEVLRVYYGSLWSNRRDITINTEKIADALKNSQTTLTRLELTIDERCNAVIWELSVRVLRSIGYSLPKFTSLKETTIDAKFLFEPSGSWPDLLTLFPPNVHRATIEVYGESIFNSVLDPEGPLSNLVEGPSAVLHALTLSNSWFKENQTRFLRKIFLKKKLLFWEWKVYTRPPLIITISPKKHPSVAVLRRRNQS